MEWKGKLENESPTSDGHKAVISPPPPRKSVEGHHQKHFWTNLD